MLTITCQRIPYESILCSVTITDTKPLVNNAVYNIRALHPVSLDVVYDKTISGPFNGNTEDYTYTKQDSATIFKTVFNLHEYGASFLIQVERVDNRVSVAISDKALVTTLPEVPVLHELDINKIRYNESGLPSAITLTWDGLRKPNPNVVGYVVCYSTSIRGSNTWEEWHTVFSGDGVLILPLTYSSYEFDTAGLFSGDTVYDIRFAIKSIDNTFKQNTSRASNTVLYTFSNCVTTVVEPSGCVLKYEFDDINTKPVTIKFGTDQFSHNSVRVLLRKSRYSTPFANYKEVYTYELKATSSLIRPISITIHIELLMDTKYEIRIKQDNKWIHLPSVRNYAAKHVTFIIASITDFAILIPDTSLSKYNSLIDTAEKKFAHYTNVMLNRFPIWSKLRRNPVNSLGASFLNVFGLEYDEMKFILDYATDQQYVSTLDTSVLDWVHKIKPDIGITEDMYIKLYSDGSVLQEVRTLADFLTSDDTGSYRPKVMYDNPYLVDYEEGLIYIRKPYDSIKCEIHATKANLDGIELIHEATYIPEWHHVWGFVDEFGLLLDLTRLKYETNAHFKERILDVFANPSNASKEGLMNGIARELGIRHNKVWANPRLPFTIDDPMVIINYIKVDGITVDKEYISFDKFGNIVIAPLTANADGVSTVSYVSGLEMHTFFKKDDHIFRNQLYHADGVATSLFRHYVERIKQEVPIEWGYFTWNESYWDITGEGMDGYGFLPTVLDARITGFRNYNQS